jgi:hypothetical protein
MPPKKPQDLKDIINAASKLFNKPAPRGASAVASAKLSQVQNVSNKSTQAISKSGNKTVKTVTNTVKSQLGDPKKGYKDVVGKTGAWLIPYGKGFKVVNSAVKGAKYYKSAKLARGAVKGGMLLGASTVLDKAVKSAPSVKKK